MILLRHATSQISEDLFTVAAYAPDDLLPVIAARGCTVRVTTASDEREQKLAAMYEDIEPDTGIA